MKTFESIEDKGFDLALDKVFMGYDEAVCLSDREEVIRQETAHREKYPEDWRYRSNTRDVVFFQKDMIKIKTHYLDVNRRDQRYVHHTDTHCIRFFPTLGMLKYVDQANKNTARFWLNKTYVRHFWESMLNFEGNLKVLYRYLRYFGYSHLEEPFRNVVPMASGKATVNPYCPMKYAWRQPTFRMVLKAARLPVCRSMVSILAKGVHSAQEGKAAQAHMNDYATFPALAGAASIWSITHDLDLTREALSKNIEFNYRGKLRFIKKYLLQGGNKNIAKNLARELIDNGNPWMIDDTVTAYKDLIKLTGEAPIIVSTKLRDIHDELAKLSAKVTNSEWEKELEYRDNLKAIDKLKFTIEETGQELKLRLPTCANELLDWGSNKQLNHCIDGMGYRRKLHQGEIDIIGVYEHNKLKYAITIQISNGEIEQFKGYSNCYPTIPEYDAIVNKLAVYGIIELRGFKHYEDPRKHKSRRHGANYGPAPEVEIPAPVVPNELDNDVPF